MEDCIFCKIIAGEIGMHKVYEDENVISFLDINPQSLGHSLITLKSHVKNLVDVNDKEALSLFNAVRELTSILEEKLGADGISIVENKGILQEVSHVHLHIIPAYLKPEENSINKTDFEQIIKLINN